MNTQTLSELREAYINNQLIPVVGSGLSLPFSLPDWATLLCEAADHFNLLPDQIQALQNHLSNWQYLEACNIITVDAKIPESDLQNFVANRLRIAKEALDPASVPNNYTDLAQMKHSRFLTTNYDEFLNDFIPDSKRLYLDQLKNIKTNVLSRKRFCGSVIPIHGEISQPESIVLSEASYQNVYDSEEFDPAFQVLRQQFTFLFMGFSFDDVYFKKLFHKVVGGFESGHYILFAENQRANKEKIRELYREYHVKSIFYDASESHATGIHNLLHDIIFFHDDDIELGDFNAELPLHKETESEELRKFRAEADEDTEHERITPLRIRCEALWSRPDFSQMDVALRLEVLVRLMWCSGYAKDMEESYGYMQYAEQDPVLSQHLDKLTIMFAQLQWNRRDWKSARYYLETYIAKHLKKLGERSSEKDSVTPLGEISLLLDVIKLYEKYLPDVQTVAGELPVYEKEPWSMEMQEERRKTYRSFRNQYIHPVTNNLLHPTDFRDQKQLEIAYYWLGVTASQLFHEHEDAVQFLYRAYELNPKLIYMEELAVNYLAIAEMQTRYRPDAKTYELNRPALLKARECFMRVMNETADIDQELLHSFYRKCGLLYLRCLYLLKDFLRYEQVYDQLSPYLEEHYGLLVDKAMCDAQIRYSVEPQIYERLKPEEQFHADCLCEYSRIMYEKNFAVTEAEWTSLRERAKQLGERMAERTTMQMTEQLETQAAEQTIEHTLWETNQSFALLMLDCFWIARDGDSYRYYMEKMGISLDGYYYECCGELSKAQEWFEEQYRLHQDVSLLHVLLSFLVRNRLEQEADRWYEDVISDEERFDTEDRCHFGCDYIMYKGLEFQNPFRALELYGQYYDLLAYDEESLMRVEEQLREYAGDYSDVDRRKKRLRYLKTYAPDDVKSSFYATMFWNYMGNFRYSDAEQLFDEMKQEGIAIPETFIRFLAIQKRKQKSRFYTNRRPSLSSAYLPSMERTIRQYPAFELPAFGLHGKEVVLSVWVIMMLFKRRRQKELDLFGTIYITYGGVRALQESMMCQEDPFLRMVSQWMAKAENVQFCAPTLRGLASYPKTKKAVVLEKLQMEVFVRENPEVFGCLWG